MRLEKKVAVITGAGRGIGKAIAIRLAEEGASIVVNDVDQQAAANTATKIKGIERESLAIRADVSNRQEVEQMFEQAEQAFGRIDILVNNAGVRRDSPFHEMVEGDLDAVTAVQLKGSFNCAQVAQRYMVKQSYGKIVNISAPIPAGWGEPGQVNYAAVSAGLFGFTKTLALELGRYNINVNCVAPDFIDTEMTRAMFRRHGFFLNDFKRFAEAQVPLRRVGKVEEVANVVLFLVSDESSFVSGQVIHVKGGP